MPGLLIMNQNGADGAAGVKDAQGRNGDSMVPPASTKPMTNGDRGVPQVDGPLESGGAFPLNGGKQIVAGHVGIPASLLELPPELVHITNYTPLSTLFSRVAQECFNDLTETLTKMADLPVTQQPGLTNGASGHTVNGAGNTTVNNTRKKQIMMEFAEQHRTRFVKLLVLSSWSRQSETVQRLVDVSNWQNQQTWHYFNVVDAMGNLKREMEHATLKSPDIETALHVLATGKTPWLSTFGYIPAKPLSAQQILKLWRDLDVRSSIRLNLHEDLPRHLKQWKIGSGRVTFTVPSEFELDVGTNTEDASMPWYFIDLRFLFSPAPEIPDSQFRNILDAQCNDALGTNGLSGCFNYLHNLVLTHKIAVLKLQAYQMLSANWAGSLKVEDPRRSLLVQYWTEAPGKKSWIEFGIVSGKPKNGKISWKGPTPPQVAVRWFRQGVEVKEPRLSFDWQALSMESILRKVIAHHIGHVLETVRDRLLASARGIPTLKTEVSLSETEPSDCALEVNLGNSTNSTTVLMDPVTGRFAMQPCTAISAFAENEVNNHKDPMSIMSSRISMVLCATLQISVEKQAQLLGWTTVTNLKIRTDSIREAIKQDVVRYTLFQAPGWTRNWVLAAVFNLAGVSWWTIASESGNTGVTITAADLVPSDMSYTSKGLTLRDVMTELQRKAVANISLSATKKSLVLRNVQHNTIAAKEPHEIPELYVDAVAFLKSELQGAEPWSQTLMRLRFKSFDTGNSTVLFSIDGVMTDGYERDIATIIHASRSSDIKFHGENNSKFNVVFSAPFGTSLETALSARLREITHLLHFVTILRSRKFETERIIPNRIVFKYGGSYNSTVTFAPNEKITLQFPRSNPHHRIREFLAARLNEARNEPAKFRTAINTFTFHLIATLPLLRALEALKTSPSDPSPEGKEVKTESSEDQKPDPLAFATKDTAPSIHSHAPDAFRISYKNPRISFDANLRIYQDKHVWHLEDAGVKNPEQRAKTGPRSDKLRKGLDALWREGGEDWEGVRTSIVAGMEGVAEAVARLHEVVSACWVEGGEVVETAASGSGSVVANAGGSQNLNVNANAGKGVGLGISNIKSEPKPPAATQTPSHPPKPNGPGTQQRPGAPPANRKVSGGHGHSKSTSNNTNVNMRGSNGGAPDVITID